MIDESRYDALGDPSHWAGYQSHGPDFWVPIPPPTDQQIPMGKSAAWERQCPWTAGFPADLRDDWLYHAIRFHGYVVAGPNVRDLTELEAVLEESACSFLDTVPWALADWREERTVRHVAEWISKNWRLQWVKSWRYKPDQITGACHRAQVRSYVEFATRKLLLSDPAKVTVRGVATYCGVSPSTAHRVLRSLDSECLAGRRGPAAEWTPAELERLQTIADELSGRRLTKPVLEDICADFPKRSPHAVRMALLRTWEKAGVRGCVHGRRWTEEEDTQLREALAGVEVQEEVVGKLAQELGRTPGAVRKRADRLHRGRPS